MITAVALAIVLGLAGPSGQAGGQPDLRPDMVAGADHEAEVAAMRWLALVDAGDFDAAHAAGSARFRETLDLPAFRSSISATRGPLAAVINRRSISVANVEDGGRDYVIVRFRTDFENRDGLVEQVVLERDGDALKVTGYFFV